MKYYYLAPWEWYTGDGSFSYWRAPGGNAIDAVDLRSISQCSKRGGISNGFGVFSYETKQTIAKATKFTTEKQAVEYIWKNLTVDADPTGQTGPKPLCGRKNKNVMLILGGKVLKSEPFNDGHRKRNISVFQVDYKKNRRNYSIKTVQKWVGSTMQDLYGEMSDENAKKIVPVQYHGEEPLWRAPETIITESWNCANSDSLNCDLTWTELEQDIDIVSNQARTTLDVGDGKTSARADSDLSTDDHYAQAQVDTTISSSAEAGVITRKDSSATLTWYMHDVVWGSNVARLFKRVSGTFTSLGNGSVTLSVGTPVVVRGEVDGSTVKVLVDGNEIHSNTDTAITGNLRTGLRGVQQNSGHYTRWDDFEAGDLEAAAKIRHLAALGVG